MALINAKSKKESKKEITLSDSIWKDIDTYCKYAEIGVTITAKRSSFWGKQGKNGEYYGVLRGARAAGAKHYFIIEHSFHTNKKACNWLLNKENLQRLAREQVNIIAKHYNLKKKHTTTNEQKTYLVKVNTDVLNIRSGAGTNYPIKGTVKRGDVYTIVETKGNWGKLKSGAGWICLDYTIKR